LEQDGWDDALNLSVSEVITIVKKFLADDAGFENIRITSAVAIEGEAEWKVTADIGQPARDKKEIIVNDRDGKIISYKVA
jgi:hypothetical protein